MAGHKLLLELEEDLESYVLIAVHCSEADFKMAYMLNRVLNFKLQREPEDLLFFYPDVTASYPLFLFDDINQDRRIHLIANSSRTLVSSSAQITGGLFQASESPTARLTYLIPELKQADYLLKISSPKNNHSENVIVSRINEIAQVITAYVVDLQLVKSRNNLIFE